jgi:hypothetical protein
MTTGYRVVPQVCSRNWLFCPRGFGRADTAIRGLFLGSASAHTGTAYVAPAEPPRPVPFWPLRAAGWL